MVLYYTKNNSFIVLGGLTMYEYTCVELPIKREFETNRGDTFKVCMETIHRYAKDGWRLVQIVIPANEKTGVMAAYAYEIIFEKQIIKN